MLQCYDFCTDSESPKRASGEGRSRTPLRSCEGFLGAPRETSAHSKTIARTQGSLDRPPALRVLRRLRMTGPVQRRFVSAPTPDPDSLQPSTAISSLTVLEVHRELLLDEVRTNAYREAIRRVSLLTASCSTSGQARGSWRSSRVRQAHVACSQSRIQHSADLAMFWPDSSALPIALSDPRSFHEARSSGTGRCAGDRDTRAFGFEERILSSVIDARTRLLRPGATIIPQRVELFVVRSSFRLSLTGTFRGGSGSRMGSISRRLRCSRPTSSMCPM